MAFADITDRIAEILEAERSRLVDGLMDPQIVIERRFPETHFANQVLFVYRAEITDLEYGTISNPGGGEAATGEIYGHADWIVSAHVRFTGAEETAADQLSRLVWNLLRVLAGYTADPLAATYTSLFVVSSTPDYALTGTGGQGWYIGERLRLRIGWDMTF